MPIFYTAFCHLTDLFPPFSKKHTPFPPKACTLSPKRMGAFSQNTTLYKNGFYMNWNDKTSTEALDHM